MRGFTSLMAGLALSGLVACQPERAAPAAELAFLEELQAELALERAESREVVSALELGAAESEVAEAPVEPVAPRRSSAPVAASRSSAGYEAPGPAPAPAPRVVTVKHVKRDAAIGAVAGAAIGAVAGGSKRRVQGAVVGAVVGGVAGAVIGNNVDKSTRVEY